MIQTQESNKFYAGIGSRKTPAYTQVEMNYLAGVLSDKGYTLRSGNAEGADQAFASGVKNDMAHIWLPWKHFQLNFQKKFPHHKYIPIDMLEDLEAFHSVSKFHPHADVLSVAGYQFMARNYRQVIGRGWPNSKFVICWTECGEYKGGTAQAMRIADHFQIPILNLAKLSATEVLKEIEKIELLYD